MITAIKAIEGKYMEMLIRGIKEVITTELSEKYKFDSAEALLYLEEKGEEAVVKGTETKGRPKKEKKKTVGEKVNEEKEGGGER